MVELVPDELAMALDVFTSVRYLLKPEEICIDNWINQRNISETLSPDRCHSR